MERLETEKNGYTSEEIIVILRRIDNEEAVSEGEMKALQACTFLNFDSADLTDIPESIGLLSNLITLDLRGTDISALPGSIGKLSNLQELCLSGTKIRTLPDSIQQLAQLRDLDISSTEITSFPESIVHLTGLKSLELTSTLFFSLPDTIGNLENLEMLSLGNSNVLHLPDSIGKLVRLECLPLRFSRLSLLPDTIGCLANLKYLDLFGTPIKNLPDSVGNIVELQTIDISNTQVETLPESVGKLSHLKTLNISNAPIKTLPNSIGNLSELEVLVLSNTQITTLPDSVGQLSRLKTLSLGRTPISFLPNSIGNLGSLQTLDVSNTALKTLPDSIGDLSALVSLDLTGSAIDYLPDSIGKLASLVRLDPHFTNIKSLPNTIGQLCSLERLNLWKTKISDLPASFCELPRLKRLYLRDTMIHELPAEFGNLTTLERLDLSYTSVSTLPDSMAGLIELKTLDLSDTRLTAIPEWIGNLPKLQHLDLNHLTLPTIPKTIGTLGLRFVEQRDNAYDSIGINLFGTTITNQNKYIFLESPELILGLYNSNELVPLCECRVIFLGDGASGKSYTIKRFRNNGKKETKKNPYITSETPGVEILDYHEDCDADSFNVHFWDFGGQQLLHSMHRCFLSEDSCYVVTVKTRETKANERAQYWLRNVSAFAPKSPVLLFVNCWEDDNGRRAIDEPGLRKEFPMIQKVVYCSAKRAGNKEFREQLMKPIIEMAATSPGCTKQVPKQWLAVRDTIEIESSANNYLTKARFHALCAENKIENEQIPELLSFFNSLGICFSYHRDENNEELDEYKLLRPVWLTNALYAIIKEGMAPAQDGRIKDTAIRQMLCNPAPVELDGKPHVRTAPEIIYKKEECPWLLAVAEAHDLCFRIDAKTMFFPALCGTDTPKTALSTPEGYPQHVTYLLRYTYLPDSVLHQLMIRCMRNHLTVEKCWQRGMILYAWNLHEVIIRMADDESLRIDVYSTGEQRAYALFWALRKEIEEINYKLNLNAKEFILDGTNAFSLGSVLGAARSNSDLFDEDGNPYNARKLLGSFYEESFIQTMRIEKGSIVIPITKRTYHAQKKSEPAFRYALYEAYNHICPYCGQPIQFIQDMQVDHILATKYQDRPDLQQYLSYLDGAGFTISKPDYIENYFPSHPHCNRSKSNRINQFTLPYWHDVAAQHAPRVMQLMEQYKPMRILL